MSSATIRIRALLAATRHAKEEMKCRGRGFTLIELMIAVAVIAILAAIAVPSYMDAVRKSRRSDATTALAKIQLAQETYRLNHTKYGSLIDLGLNDDILTNGYYTITLSDISATGYTATAKPVSGTSQAADTSCATITMTVKGGSNEVDNEPAECWSK